MESEEISAEYNRTLSRDTIYNNMTADGKEKELTYDDIIASGYTLKDNKGNRLSSQVIPNATKYESISDLSLKEIQSQGYDVKMKEPEQIIANDTNGRFANDEFIEKVPYITEFAKQYGSNSFTTHRENISLSANIQQYVAGSSYFNGIDNIANHTDTNYDIRDIMNAKEGNHTIACIGCNSNDADSIEEAKENFQNIAKDYLNTLAKIYGKKYN